MTSKPAAPQPQTLYLDASALVKRHLVETAAAFAAKRRGQFITDSEYESALEELLRGG